MRERLHVLETDTEGVCRVIFRSSSTLPLRSMGRLARSLETLSKKRALKSRVVLCFVD